MYTKSLLSLSFLMICFFSSCTQENNNEFDTSSLKDLYCNLENRNYKSIFPTENSISRTDQYSDDIIFAITKDDLKFLSSLSQSEMEDERKKLIQSLGPDGENIIDSIQSTKYEYVFNILGGHKGMDQFLDFATSYLENTESSETWEELQQFIPTNLTATQSNIYIYMALCVNKICRPVYNTLISNSNQDIATVSRSMRTICDAQLAAELSIMGVGLTAEAFLDIMTGGVMTPIEATAGCADLVSIWYHYETCNGRWH